LYYDEMYITYTLFKFSSVPLQEKKLILMLNSLKDDTSQAGRLTRNRQKWKKEDVIKVAAFVCPGITRSNYYGGEVGTSASSDDNDMTDDNNNADR